MPCLVRLGDVVSRVREEVDVHPNTTYLEIGIRSHGKGVFHKDGVLGAKIGDKAVFRVRPNCLVFNIIFAWEGAVATTTANDEGRVASHRFPMFQVDESVADLEYLRLFLLSKKGLHLLQLASPGGAGRNKTLSLQGLLDSRLPLPGVSVQRSAARIAKIMSSHERSLERLVEAKRRHKRALLQQLLTGKSRTKTRVVALAGVVRLRSGNTPSKARLDYWEGDFPWVSAKDLKRPRIGDSIDKITALAVQESATVVPAGTVVILVRGMTLLKDVPVAVATRELAINQDIKGLEPSAEIDSGFLLCTLAAKRSQLMGFVNRAGHGTGKLDTDRLLSLPLRLPPLDEQRRIAASIEFLDHEANLLERQLAAYRQLKRGLMQRLLTHELPSPSLSS